VIERGLPVLKHAWEESTPSEKAIMAGMVVAMSDPNCPVGEHRINRTWTSCDVTMPKGKWRTPSEDSLHDIINGEDKQAFTVDLQRL